MIGFWRYLCGYVTILICGKNAEKILNVAARQRINIWGMRCEKGNIIGNVSIKNFYKLRIAKRGIKCPIKILKKRGALFYSNKYKLRIGFILGFISFVLLLEVLSGYIWIVNVEGNKKIKEGEIINTCNKIGIYEGIKVNKINPQNDAQRLLLYCDDLAWASFNIEGSVLNINLTEITKDNDDLSNRPTNIKASFDGKIEKIDVSRGNTLVKSGDFVVKGDLLVSGIIQQFGTTVFAHSEGKIIALTEREFCESASFLQKIDITTKNGKRYAFEVLGKRIPLFLNNHKGKCKAVYNSKHLRLFGNKIPIKIASENYSLKSAVKHTFSKDKLVDKLREKIDKSVEKSNFISCEKLSEEIIETEDGIMLKIKYKCRENIAETEEILLGAQN